MKEIAIIGSYCDSDEKINLLKDCISKCKENGLDVLLYAKYPISYEIQNTCDYYIFQKSNPIIENRYVLVWRDIGDVRMYFKIEDYGYSAIEQIKNGLGFSFNLNYNIAYWINYDIDMINFQLYKKEINDLIKNKDIVCNKFGGGHHTGKGVFLTNMVFNVKKSFDILNSLINIEHYKNMMNKSDKMAEGFFEECLKISNLNYHIIENPPILKDKFRMHGNRTNGDILEKNNKLYTYFLNFHVSTCNENKKNKKIFIYNLKKIIKNIKIDIGTEIINIQDVKTCEFKDGDKYIMLNLTENIPTKIIILSINDKEMFEILEDNLDDNYWKRNFIEGGRV